MCEAGVFAFHRCAASITGNWNKTLDEQFTKLSVSHSSSAPFQKSCRRELNVKGNENSKYKKASNCQFPDSTRSIAC